MLWKRKDIDVFPEFIHVNQTVNSSSLSSAPPLSSSHRSVPEIQMVKLSSDQRQCRCDPYERLSLSQRILTKARAYETSRPSA
jgi:hypothetical protein